MLGAMSAIVFLVAVLLPWSRVVKLEQRMRGELEPGSRSSLRSSHVPRRRRRRGGLPAVTPEAGR